MSDPYAPPKTQEKPRPKILDVFEQLTKYQQRIFYVGLALLIGSVAIPSDPETILGNTLIIVGSIGAILIVTAIFSTLPLVIWGFFRGYREGRK
ncbi:hypothetical protein NT6N_22860 [Oceaniferula spumae]|uniref:Uncharacterized protein n=1 Tax=Oceaniferula spumae TaxID=2979115 RepID=A0AAT9FMV4_9BACT